MARTITAAAQTELDKDHGTEVTVVLEIFWSKGTESKFYADRKIPNEPRIEAGILQMSDIDQAVQVSGGGQSKSYNVTLDDTSGEIKALFDAHDFHKAPVQAWYFVSGTTFDTDKISIFKGQINSPVKWSEGQRQVELSVVNRIEDVEIGFSAEEGDFPALPEDLIGRAWPLCFGTTTNIPALRAVPAISGALQNGVGIKDFTLPARLALAEKITCPQTPIGFQCVTQIVSAANYQAKCNIAYEQDQACIQARCVEVERLKLELAEQISYEFRQITIFNGTQFPQGRTITLNINGGEFTGEFAGTPTSPSNVFNIRHRKHPKDDGKGGVIKDAIQTAVESKCPGSTESQDSNFVDTAFGEKWTGIRKSRLEWEAYRNAQSARFFWAGGGSTVTMKDNNEIVYIANLIPSTILRVAAWRTLNGNRFLLTVPDEFYEIRQTNYGGYTGVMEIVFQRPLSSEQFDTGGGWTDDIFVTQTSTVGPNTVDIIEYFIDTYTNFGKDSTSFTDVKTKLENYPMHVPYLEREGILSVLQDIAQKARCAVWQRDDTFFIKYLAEDPTTVDTITESDILQDDRGFGSLNIELTKTEDLVTSLVSRWKKDYSVDDDLTLILNHKVGGTNGYGSHKREENYRHFVHLDLVRKSSTFWLIRWANTWKRITCFVSLEFLKLEAFDAVSVTLPDVGTGTFKCIVERATLDTERKRIKLEMWTPIRAGEMTSYDFAYPASISEKALFPTLEAKNAKEAGSGTEPNFSTLAPPGHPLKADTTGIFSGAQLGCNGVGVVSLKPGDCRQDHGDSNPSDTGDEKPTVDTTKDTTQGISGSTSPVSGGAGDGYGSDDQKAKDQRNKTENDAGRSRENSQRGAEDQNEDERTKDGNNDDLRDLPKPEDLPDNVCKITVTVTGFPTKNAENRTDLCIPVGGAPSFTDVYVYGSPEAAQQACASLSDSPSCEGKPPCGMCVTSCSVSGTCQPGQSTTDALIGFCGGSNDYTIMGGAN